MLINPSFGFNDKFGNYWDAKIGPIPESYPINPRQKLEELRCHFNNKYRDYEIVDRPLIQTDGANFFIPFDGRLNFVNKKHKDLFFQELQKLDDKNNLYGRCRHFYRQSDNCLLKCWLNQYSPQTPAVIEEDKLVDTIFLQTLPKNVIIFPYLNDDFSKWPEEEKIRFYVFLKNAGGENAVKSFEKFTAEEARRSEHSFTKWACARLDIVSESVNAVNLPEQLFQKLDEIMLPQIFNIKADDKRRRCLYAYGCFIGMRNAVNPVSLLAGLTSFHKLGELWDKLVSFFKMEGSADEFALTLGRMMGSAMGAPLGIRLLKLTIPKAMSLLKRATGKFKMTAQKLDKALDEIFNPPKRQASAPKPAKTREQRQAEYLANREKTLKDRLVRAKTDMKIREAEAAEAAKKQNKPVKPKKTKSTLSVPQEIKHVVHYRTGKTLFERFEYCLSVKRKLPSKKQINKQIETLRKEVLKCPDKQKMINEQIKKLQKDALKLKQIDEQINKLRNKALYLLQKSEAANPPAEISFENNWRLCVLKIHSHRWKDAISYFRKTVDKHTIIKSQHCLVRYLANIEHEKAINSLNQNIKLVLDKFEKGEFTEKHKNALLIKYEKYRKTLEQKKANKISLCEKLEKYQKKIIGKTYKDFTSEVKKQTSFFEKIEKETEKRAINLGKYNSGMAKQIATVEKELDLLEGKILKARSGKVETEKMLHESLSLSDLEKRYALKSLELQLLKNKLKKLNADFLTTCQENAKAKAKLRELKQESIQTFRIQMIQQGLNLWPLN